MGKLWFFIKELLWMIKQILVLILKETPYVLGVVLIYLFTYEKNEKLGTISKRKYRRIKQAIRYKIWVWKHMRWLCKFYHVDYTQYLKYEGNKDILKY